MVWRVPYAVATLLLISIAGISQTCPTSGTTNLNTNPNTYYPGTGTVNVGATTIAVGAIGIGTTPIAAGNLILIIQMQGTEISTANSNNYGDNVAGAPASGYLTNANHLSGNKAITIQLTDMTGRTVLSKTDRASGGQYRLTVPVSLKGMYLLQVSGGSAVYQQKLVIE